jgi:hypothetical protein
MRSFSVLLALLFGLFLNACAQKTTYRKVNKPPVFQGICGTVGVKRGNYMPGPDSPRPNPAGKAVEREVLIFPLLNISQVDQGEDGFINSVRDVQPIKTIKSDRDGKFCVNLPIGRYSVVIREPKGLYANLFDSQNNIFPVSVEKGKKVTVKVEITHQAVF